MPQVSKAKFSALLGYELHTFDEAIGLQLTYGALGSEPSPKDRKTPTLFLLPDEARDLARDLLAAADKIESEGGPPPDPQVH
ncbi:MAG: hypothetical protein JWQ49_4336 [Edaphobacter sp.]|nr:hypothetical protein [Edaphobacter sp.]